MMNDLMRTAAAEAAAVARGVRPDQYGLATPCPEWNVRTLANHLALWGAYRSELAARRLPAPADGSLDEGRDLMAEGWPEVFTGQVAKAAEAWASPGAWEGMTDFGGATMPAALTGELLLGELVVHGWDLAVATGQRLRCADEVAEAVYRGMAQVADQGRQMGLYGSAVAVGSDASPLARVLAFSGRDPGWSPSA
jgi:uncharacterized protein (TIGR03086 family)